MKNGFLLLTLVGLTFLLTACPGDDKKEKSGETKLSLCKTLWDAYCDSAVEFGCVGAENCKTHKYHDCETLFDGTCEATAEDQEKVEHDIERIIEPKVDCASLESIHDYEQDTIDFLKSDGCGTAVNSGAATDTASTVSSDQDTGAGVDTATNDPSFTYDPNLNITSECQMCVQTQCPVMDANCKAMPGCTGFINEVCDCACNASDDFFGLFMCIMVSASDNAADVQTGAEDLGSCISEPGAPCTSSCPNFGCQCNGGGVIDDCNFCIAQTCIDQTIGCFDNLECLALIDCVNICEDDACVDLCGQYFPNGVDDFVNLVTCVADGCPVECGL